MEHSLKSLTPSKTLSYGNYSIPIEMLDTDPKGAFYESAYYDPVLDWMYTATYERHPENLNKWVLKSLALIKGWNFRVQENRKVKITEQDGNE